MKSDEDVFKSGNIDVGWSVIIIVSSSSCVKPEVHVKIDRGVSSVVENIGIKWLGEKFKI